MIRQFLRLALSLSIALVLVVGAASHNAPAKAAALTTCTNTVDLETTSPNLHWNYSSWDPSINGYRTIKMDVHIWEIATFHATQEGGYYVGCNKYYAKISITSPAEAGTYLLPSWQGAVYLYDGSTGNYLASAPTPALPSSGTGPFTETSGYTNTVTGSPTLGVTENNLYRGGSLGPNYGWGDYDPCFYYIGATCS